MCSSKTNSLDKNGIWFIYYILFYSFIPECWSLRTTGIDCWFNESACSSFPHSSLLLQVTLLKMPPLIRFLLKAVNRIRGLVPRQSLQYSDLYSVSRFFFNNFPKLWNGLGGFSSEVHLSQVSPSKQREIIIPPFGYTKKMLATIWWKEVHLYFHFISYDS